MQKPTGTSFRKKISIFLHNIVHAFTSAIFFAYNGQIWCRFTISETFNCYCISSMTIKVVRNPKVEIKVLGLLTACKEPSIYDVGIF